MWHRILGAPRARRYTFVAEDADGQVAGFASGGPQRSELPGYKAELYAIYLLPTCQRQGLGRRLVRAVAAQFAAHELRSMVVWVFEANERARRFYEQLGGRRVGTAQFELGGVALQEVAYGWPEVDALSAPA
jgi:L-amino acid N-acyltransferase YncA